MHDRSRSNTKSSKPEKNSSGNGSFQEGRKIIAASSCLFPDQSTVEPSWVYCTSGYWHSMQYQDLDVRDVKSPPNDQMVRLKNRYILFEVLYPPPSYASSHDERLKFQKFASSPKDCVLNLHASSPATVNSRTLAALFKKVVSDHYGELAAGTVGQSIIVKYFSNRTSTGIIRCSRADFHLVVAAVALINKVEKRDVVVKCVHVSGTIRKCEDFAIQRSRELIRNMEKENEPDHHLHDLALMIRADEADEGR